MNRHHPVHPLSLILSLIVTGTSLGAARLTLNFNPDWRFIKDDPAGASAPQFDDRAWSVVSAPHTYNDVDTYDDWSVAGHRGEGNQWGGRTWYRKTFVAPTDWNGRKVFVEFEAVRQFAEVYLNGHRLGISRNGFAPFGFELTPHLKIGEPNVLAVMCDNRFRKDRAAADGGGRLADETRRANEEIPEELEQVQPDQLPWNNPHWHPAHGGIYRNVKIHVTDPLHISLPLYSFLTTVGPYAYATNVSDQSAAVSVEVPLENDRAEDAQVEVVVEVLDRDGKSVLKLNKAGNVQAGSSETFKVSGVLTKPTLWEPGYPYRYKIVCGVRAGGQVVDSCELPLGIRTVKWDVATGFHITGKHLKLRGWGQKSTNEWPGIGAAQPDWLQFFTLNLMKQAGGNFVRWGHVAGGPVQVEAADRLGLITLQPGVDGEGDTRGAAWRIRADTFRDIIIYYRNHPSILIWEGGNQKVSKEHAAELRGFMDKYDPHGGRAYAHRRADQISASVSHISIGTEGGREIKDQAVVEGEYNREESPRRVWDDFSPPNFGYPEAKGMTYQLTSEQFAVNQVGQWMKKLSAADHCGGANWIFSDSTSGGRVPAEVCRTSGEVDGVRLPKEAYYVCQVVFSDDPRVHIIGHWTYPTDRSTKKPVYVVSNAESVELVVNGKSLGKGTQSDRYLFTFPEVQWEAGEVKAVASTGGRVVAEQSRQTAGSAVALKLTPITGPGGLRADGSDYVLIDVEAVDANGQRCPTFQQRVDFELEGPGIWRGGYNSGKINSINHPYLDLEAGINRVAVRSTLQAGAITVRARCEGLKAGSATVQASPVKMESGFATEMPALPAVELPRPRPTSIIAGAASAQTSSTAGRFTQAFSYTGPTSGCTVVADARDGGRVYVGRDAVFQSLPAELVGADYVQAPAADNLYSAVDLMQLAAKPASTVCIAYDEALPAPEWLRSQFKPTDRRLTINGRPMKLYTRQISGEESLTFGSNSEDPRMRDCNMYVVFINQTSKGR
jgi:beta-galactosidase